MVLQLFTHVPTKRHYLADSVIDWLSEAEEYLSKAEDYSLFFLD